MFTSTNSSHLFDKSMHVANKKNEIKPSDAVTQDLIRGRVGEKEKNELTFLKIENDHNDFRIVARILNLL